MEYKPMPTCELCGEEFGEFEPYTYSRFPDQFGTPKPVHIHDCLAEREDARLREEILSDVSALD